MRRGTRVSHTPLWDGEPTELDLGLDFEQIERASLGAARVEHPVEDDDLPMLDASEFVVALSLEALEPTMRIRSVRAPLEIKPRPNHAYSWAAALGPWAAILLTAWVFRDDIARLLGLI